VKAVLGQLKRGYAIKHLSLERQSSGSDGRIGGRDEEFLLDGTLWGRWLEWSGGFTGLEIRGRAAEGWEKLPTPSRVWKLRIHPPHCLLFKSYDPLVFRSSRPPVELSFLHIAECYVLPLFLALSNNPHVDSSGIAGTAHGQIDAYHMKESLLSAERVSFSRPLPLPLPLPWCWTILTIDPLRAVEATSLSTLLSVPGFCFLPLLPKA
jgi:hypothetical protein